MFCTFQDVLHMLQLCLPRISEIAVNLKQTWIPSNQKQLADGVCCQCNAPWYSQRSKYVWPCGGISWACRVGVLASALASTLIVTPSVTQLRVKPQSQMDLQTCETSVNTVSHLPVTCYGMMLKALHYMSTRCYITLNIQIFLYIPLHSLARMCLLCRNCSNLQLHSLTKSRQRNVKQSCWITI